MVRAAEAASFALHIAVGTYPIKTVDTMQIRPFSKSFPYQNFI
jgi:sorbitol-specific phosphotransferase system component IIBC